MKLQVAKTEWMPQICRRGMSTYAVIALIAAVVGIGGVLFVVRSQSLETGHAAEAFEYLAEVQSAQQLYFARTGRYADTLVQLDLSVPAPAHFSIGPLETFPTPSANNPDCFWRLYLVRAGASPLYGAYQITFKPSGFSASESSIQPSLVPSPIGHSPFSNGMSLAKLER
ncbi:hypothetical protein [Novipirellula artificiosorum]|uniref:Type II secretion system protein G n=1 Tax=Novipirellula artificiosorum TaxID=2528016 RepID=A0A5C6D633_9BACT|nr:hypothetical protein [Novipirellula artificiosorum]TWU32280.1 hypothetical protein Poly41_57650 [Novipirellula artificiosorum]